MVARRLKPKQMSPDHPNQSMVAILNMTCCDLENDVHIIKHNELFVLSQ